MGSIESKQWFRMTVIIMGKQPQIHHLCIVFGDRKGKTWSISSNLILSGPKEAVKSGLLVGFWPNPRFQFRSTLIEFTAFKQKTTLFLFENMKEEVKIFPKRGANLGWEWGQNSSCFGEKNLQIVIFQHERIWISKTCSLSQIHTHRV